MKLYGKTWLQWFSQVHSPNFKKLYYNFIGYNELQYNELAYQKAYRITVVYIFWDMNFICLSTLNCNGGIFYWHITLLLRGIFYLSVSRVPQLMIDRDRRVDSHTCRSRSSPISRLPLIRKKKPRRKAVSSGCNNLKVFYKIFKVFERDIYE